MLSIAEPQLVRTAACSALESSAMCSRVRRFRDTPGPHPTVDAAVDLWGRWIPCALFRRSTTTGRRRAVYLPRHHASLTSAVQSSSPVEMYLWRLITTIEAHEQAGLLTDVESRTMRFLLLSGWNYARIAEYEGVKRQAVQQRVEGKRLPDGRVHGGIRKKAPELVAMWDRCRAHLKQEARCRPCAA